MPQNLQAPQTALRWSPLSLIQPYNIPLHSQEIHVWVTDGFPRWHSLLPFIVTVIEMSLEALQKYREMKEALNVLKFTFQTAAWLKEGHLGQQPVAVLPEDVKLNTQQVDHHHITTSPDVKVCLLQPFFFSSSVLKNKNNINNNKKTKLPSRPLSVFPKKTTYALTWWLNRVKGTNYQHHHKTKQKRCKHLEFKVRAVL